MNLAVEHLLLRLQPIQRRLRAAVARRTGISAQTVAPEGRSSGVSPEDAALLLDHLDARLREGEVAGAGSGLDPAEAALERLMIARAAEAGASLPLEALRETLGLDEQEIGALLCSVAPELDGSYELVFGYIVDDLNRRHTTLELVAAALAQGLHAELALRDKLGRAGKLQRFGLLEEVDQPAPTERHRVLRPTRAALRYLLADHWLDGGSLEAGACRMGGDPRRLFTDPWEIEITPGALHPPGVDAAELDLLARGLSRRSIDVVGVWGPGSSARRDAILALADRARLRLRRLDPARVQESFALAAECRALLWCDADEIAGRSTEAGLSALLAQMPLRVAPVCLTALSPLRPPSLVLEARFGELFAAEPTLDERAALWTRALPELGEAANRLAARLRLDPARVRAVARMAETQAELVEAHSTSARDHVERALACVTRSEVTRFTTLIEPKRSRDDLVLPDAVHRSVLDVAEFFRASSVVADQWGMGHLLTGGGGIKALFTGDSGTGKTLAAEVIAHELGLPLLRVELARIMSKWIGETEQHLEIAFNEAEANHAVLFFDEADALFGKRGQVQRGADRYANLEVSYLLTRLEDYAGVAVLATNLRDNIDAAFTRRFQIVVNFPRPAARERLRIWRRAFPVQAPLSEGVDLELLANLDLTGAGIVACARTAALLAVQRGDPVIGMPVLITAVARQYQREARILPPRDLGQYAALLDAR